MSRLNILPSNPDPSASGRFPSWLHRKLPKGNALMQTGHILSSNRLHTVCEEARCPNLQECWSRKTATFLTMGKECTRNCGFCSIDFSKTPKALDPEEPLLTASSVKELGLKHVVLTMVARDDLSDGGAFHLTNIIQKIRELNPGTTIETLTSDFNGNEGAWHTILKAAPEIFNYNIETVRSLTPRVRHKATYDRTLKLLSYARDFAPKSSLLIKSGLMVGFGEAKEEVFETLKDLKSAGCDIVTIGQYLQADPKKLLVKAFIHPDIFKEYEEFGKSLGITYVYAGPFVRSSYNAGVVFEKTSRAINSH